MNCYAKRVEQLKREHESIKAQESVEIQILEKAEQQLEDTQEAHVLLQTVAKTVQQQAHHKIAELVTRCLSSVFDDPYEFRIKFVKRRNKTEAELVFVRDETELTDPMNEVGGGVIDVASFALRLALVLMAHPPRRRILLLDEPFKNIRGEKNKSRVRDLLLRLSKETGIQFVLNVDHQAYPEFALGKVFEIGGE